jgi:transposase-like protein
MFISIVLKRSWTGEVRNVSLLVAIGVNERGYREILGICEGAKEDKTGWSAIAFVIYGTALHATHQGQISGVKQVQDAVRRFL